MPIPSPILRFSLGGRLLVAVSLMAAALITVPGSVKEAGAQTGVCPVGTTLGTTSWGTGTPGGMIWNNTAANGISGASQTYTNVAGPVDMTLSYTDPDNVNEDLDNPYLNFVTGDSWDGPVYTRTNGTYGSAFFTIVMNSLTSDQTVDWSFGFNKPVFVPDFTVSDVDWAGYGYNSSGIGTPHESFQDEVILAGQRGGNAIATTATGGSGIIDLGGGQLVAGPYTAGVNGNVGPTDAAGTVSLTTVGPVTSFNMQYSNGPDDAAADALDGSPPAPIPANSPGVSNNHAVAISNFTVCAGNLRFGDLVWADIDGDGVRDAGEPGIPGVLVSISDPQGNVIETQTTDVNGAYEFEQFPSFTWVVSIDAPAGYTATYDRDGGTLDSTAINPTTNEFDIDFGLQPDPGTISGSVFTDRTNDGLLDPAQQEVALPGVTVELSGQDLAGNSITASTTTAGDGSYTFIGVPAGVYEITETQPTVGFNDGQDTPGTNAVADGNDQHEVTLGQLESSAGNNFAEVPTSSISGTVFEDADDDGSIDVTEIGIAGVPITVDGTDVFGNAVSFATTTQADGTYLVPRLVSGTYNVTETTQPAAFADGQESVGSSGGTIGADTFTAVPLGYDDPATDYNFGELPVSSISGRVADELGGPIPGVTIQLSGTDDLGATITASTTTAADGTYSFSDLRPGTYTVTETQPTAYGDGLDSVGTIDAITVGTLGNDVISDIVITVGANGVDYDFNETLGSIAGSVVDDGGSPIAGVGIALSGTDANGQTVAASTTTAANGTYTFDDLVSGTYTVVETQPAGYGDGGETAGTSGGDDATNDQISAISLGGGVDATGYNFDETRSSLAGQVFVDPDNDGVFGSGDSPEAGVVLTLTGTDVFGAAVSATTTTAVDGTYRFDGLIEGIYQIDESQPAGLVDGIDTLGSVGGNATVNDRFSAISLGAGIGGADYDFAELPPAGVTGSVVDSNGDPIGGVTLTLTGTSTFGTTISQTTATAADGSYSFFDLPPGTYTVTETQPIGYGDGLDALGTVGGTTVGTLGNDIISDIVLGTDSIGVDYDFTETFASIAGTVVDDDGNGIAGVAIELTGTDDLGATVTASITTAADGTYSFGELLAGTYTITETQPGPYGDGGQAAGSLGGDDSTTNDQISAIPLTGGTNATGYDFDETRGSLRGNVYEDVNNNGTSQGTEPRIGGVTITLTGTDVLGNTVNLTTTTASSGSYRFDDLLAGTYTVTETQPAGYADGIDTAGAAGGDTSVNDEISAIALTGGQIAGGYLFGEIQPSSIGGTVFIDDNDNGTQNAGDIGIGGVTIDLNGTDDLGATVSLTETTATNGTYTFTNLRPGTYTVTETQPTAYLDGTETAGSEGGDDTSTNDAISAITLPTNTAATAYDFAELEGASISGAVIDDGGNPIESVVITLTGIDDLGATVTSSTTTAADGTYGFVGLRPGTYTVTETQPTAYGDGGQTAGSAGGDDTSVDDQISGIALPAASDVTGYGFDETRGSIAGVVYEDANNDGVRDGGEAGIAGVSVRLTGVDASGALIDLLITTIADGSYLFEPLLAGTYTVTETQPAAHLDGIDTAGTAGGTTATDDEINSIALPGGVDATENNFGELVASSLAGAVVDDAGTGIVGVLISLSGTDDLGATVSATATTAVDGTYSFAALRPGIYTVTETQPAAYLDGDETAGSLGGDASVDDVISTVTLPSATSATNYDFDEIRASSIGGGVVDDDGAGIAGVAITLTGTDDLGVIVSLSATTAIDGTYGFVGLRPGTYNVTETQPAAYGDGGQTAGTIAGVVVGDDTSVNDQIATITLPANSSATGYDFDETRGSIAGLVFEDTNNNGTRDAGEAAIGGATIELTGSDVLGNTVSLTGTTLSNGIVRFNDLLAGDYVVTEIQPAGYLDGIDTAGTAGGDASANDTVTSIALGGGIDATNYRFGELVASSIDGTVFDDDNGDGTQQPGEAGISNVTIELTGIDDLGAAVSSTTNTAADGTYSFAGLRPGTYAVTETQPTAYLDGIDTAGTAGGDITINDLVSAIALSSDSAAAGYDFAEIEASSIAGTVVDDAGNGIVGVTIALTGTDDRGASISLTTTTIADGTYSFAGLRPGTYAVTETQPAAYGDGGQTAGTIAGVTVGDDTSTNDQILAITLGAEETATGYNFDETRGSIAGTAYEDVDGNGVQNGTEPGISGVTVELTGTDILGDTVSLSTTSATSGAYAFEDLLAGAYTITETQPAGYADGQETVGSAGGTNSVNDQINIDLAGGVIATSYDFGEVQAASIAGTVVDDAGSGISGVTITLTGTDDLGSAVSLSATTAADGSYSFTGRRPGTYTIAETQPTAYGDGGETAGTAGGNDTTDDAISAIALASGEDATGYDFDETRGSIAGLVFEDTNNNGTQDTGEPAIIGVTVDLAGTDVLGNTISLTTTTATNGSYTFGDLLTGDYTVTETQPTGYLDGTDTAGTSAGTLGNDNISAIALAGGTNATNYTFGEILPSSIAGTVVDDAGSGINAVTITLTGTDDLGATVNASTATAIDGTYNFDVLRPGTYTVTESQPAGYLDGGETAGTLGGTVADDAISAITIPTNTDATGYDFDEIQGSSIAGSIVDDGGNPIENVAVALAGTDDRGATVTASTATATDGTYTFTNLRPGTYAITETQPAAYGDGGETAGTIAGVTVGDDSTDDVISAITLPARSDATGYDFDETRGSITGTAYEDINGNGAQNGTEPGIPGVTVELTGTDILGNTVTASTSTLTNGSYSFSDLLAGTYTVTETQPAGYADAQETIGSAGGTNAVNDEIDAIALAGGDDATGGYDFEVQAASISGTVVDDGGNPIGSVTITLTGTDDLGATVIASTTTIADGTYTFSSLRPGTYAVTETQPSAYGDGGETAGTIAGVTVGNDTADDVISAIALVSGADATGYDFDETRGSVSGVVFEDTNNNGTQDTGEPAISGVTVDLTGTDVLGNAVASNTTAASDGSYDFVDLLAGDYTVTETQPAGYLDGIDTAGAGGGIVANDNISAIALSGGSDATGYTFGEILPSSIAGTIVDDAGTGINSVTITLTGTDDLGATVNAATTTAADGTYNFAGLRPGTYTITETQPAGYLDGGETAGTLGGTVADDSISAITLPTNTDATGYDFDEIRASSIAGTVVDDAGAGISGVTVEITGTDDRGATVTASTATAADGTYTFTNLRPGTYTITETQPAAYGDGGETAGTIAGVTVGVVSNDQIAAVTLVANSAGTGYDFDETRSLIAGTVYEDVDGSGVQNGAEPGISGTTVELTGTDVLGGTINLSTTTATNGTYSFSGLLAGAYTITETQPAGYLDARETIGSAGGASTVNDQVDVTLPGGTNAIGYDFGEVQAASIAGTVFIDSDNSGSQNGTEVGVDAVAVTLTGTDDLGATVTATTTTAANGTYTFAGLRPGTYTITETQPTGLSDGLDRVGSAGGTLGNDVLSAITVDSAEDATGYDFGELEGASLSGTVVDDDGTGISTTTITLSGTDDLGATVTATTTTAANGTYTFAGLRPGTYSITESQPTGYGDGGETAGTIGGVTVGVIADDIISAITLGSGQSGTGYDFDEIRASISGSVYLDADGNGVRNAAEAGLAGVPVELAGTDDLGATVNRSTTTAADGTFTFGDLISGTYAIAEPTQPTGVVGGLEAAGTSGGVAGNTVATNDTITGIALAPGVNATDYLFGEWDTSTIGGAVVDELDNPIPGVTLTIDGAEDDGGTVTLTATTGPSGAYTFTGLEPGTYTVTESQPAAYGDGAENVGTVDGTTIGTATDDRITGIVIGPNSNGVDYDFIETLGSISGTVFDDTNGNGTFNSEPGIDNVTLTLTGTDAYGAAVNVTTTTSIDGSYSFGNVVGGVYTITQTQPAGYLDGAESIGSAGGSSTTNDVIDGIATTGGADETGYDFGEIDAASISGSVVDDAGNPIVGATITLAGTDDLGATVNLTDVTDVTGVYSFDGLRPGTYTVVETQPVGYGDGGENAGPIGGTVSDDQIAGIVLGPDTDASGNDFDEVRSTVSGRVFEDLDSSGTANAGEPGINGVSINLTGTDVLGSAVDRTIATTGDGDFGFNGLIDGTYTITESQPTAFADGDDTVGTAGGNGTLQNDVVSSIAIGAGVVESGYLFGEVAPVSVTGTVFTDTDNDGSSTGESGIGGVTVSLSGLDDRGQLVNDSTTTAADGSYSFTNLRPGVYTVTETQPGAFLDGIDSVGTVDGITTGTLGIDQITGIGMTSGQAGSGYDFGELSPSSISGSVVDDLARPIAGVTIVLTGTDDLGGPISLSTASATDGSYTFTGLRPGTYTVAETQPAAYGDGGQNAGTIDGTTIGVVADDEISAIVLGANSDGIDYDFDEATASVSGLVFTDNDGDTVPSTGDTDLVGAAIQLAGSDVNGQAVAASTATAVDGTYRFDGLLAGTYTITETQPTGLLDAIDTAGSGGGSADNSVGGDEISGVSLAAGSSSIGNNFSEVASGSISGSVSDDSGNGIGGVAITLTGTDLFGQAVNVLTITGPAGAYAFTGLTPGTYVITETQPVAYGDGGESVGTIDGSATGVATDDAISAITLLSGQSGVGYDFDETRMSISGTIVIDADNDGVADIGEAPIPGVSIELTGTDVFGATVTATTATAADGTYRFDGLLSGTYTITETQPAGFVDGAETAGSAGGTVDPAADSISGITVIAGVDATAYDFGELEAASLAGSVIDDLGRPIAGVSITLTGTDDRGNAITATGTTVADGTYTFDGLRPGTYTITETQPAAYGDGGQTAGTISGITTGVVADDQVTTIVLGSGDVGAGYDFDETTGSLAGSVLHTTGAGDAPISGVAIELSGTDANGDAVATSTTTVVDGTYTFSGLLAGDYTITETQPIAFADGPERIGTAGGDATINDVITTIALGAGTDASGYDFTETGTVLSGRVRIDRTGDGVPDPTDDLDLSGIIIDLLGSDGSVIATTTTAPDGTYVIGGLLAGDYTVRQTQPPEWGSISPNDRPISLPVTGLSNVDFDEEAASISGTVFVDDDANGLDDQDTPQSGVTVTLADGTGVIATTTTDASGSYTFIGLPAADYTVTVVAPSDSTFTIRDAGTDDSIDSDIDPSTGTVGVSLPAGADVADVDAGTVEVERDLAIAISTTASEVKVGDEVTFTTTVTNSGNTLIGGGVTVTIPVPTNTTFVSANGTGWTITIAEGVVTATRPDPLAPGEVTPPITLVVEPTQIGSISVTGQVVSSSGLVETTTSNNVSSVPVTVTATTTSIPDLAYTGSSLLLLLLIAGGLIVSGRTLILIGGPRRKDDD